MASARGGNVPHGAADSCRSFGKCLSCCYVGGSSTDWAGVVGGKRKSGCGRTSTCSFFREAGAIQHLPKCLLPNPGWFQFVRRCGSFGVLRTVLDHAVASCSVAASPKAYLCPWPTRSRSSQEMVFRPGSSLCGPRPACWAPGALGSASQTHY